VQHLHVDGEIARFLAIELRAFVLMSAADWERLAPSLSTKARVVGRQHDFYHHRDLVVVTNR
jgi:hypothetical protein